MSETKARTIVEQVENCIRYSDGTIKVQMVRATYPHVFKMQEQTDAKTGAVSKSFSIGGLLPKATHEAAKALITRQINAIIKENNSVNGVAQKLPADRKCLKDGDPTSDDDVAKPENEGMWVLSTRESSKRPATLSNVKDRATGKVKRLSPDNAEDVAKIYGGCWVDLLFRLWWQNNSYGKRVNGGIVAVQFRKDDVAFGAGRISDEEIDETFDAEDEEDAIESEDDVSDL